MEQKEQESKTVSHKELSTRNGNVTSTCPYCANVNLEAPEFNFSVEQMYEIVECIKCSKEYALRFQLPTVDVAYESDEARTDCKFNLFVK